ncbi:MAG: beta-lactamase family protein, partial [Nitrospirae bacterium]|nr:beta-lactamase family protein [Nitrospirota bacterium]
MKRFPKIIIFVAVLLVLVIISLYSLAPHPPGVPDQVENVQELDAFFERLVASGSPPGLSAAVVKNGRLVYNRAFGYADGPRGIKAVPETVYHWWSMTKIPTVVAILQLMEQGKLGLDDPVTRHLPWFNVIYPSDHSPVVTIRHLIQ